MTPRLLITLGDVAGIGPEIVARAWPLLVRQARPVVVGDPDWVDRGIRRAGGAARVQPVLRVADASPAGWKENGRFTVPEQSHIRKPNGTKFWTHPVVANGCLYLRDENVLLCYDVKAKP